MLCWPDWIVAVGARRRLGGDLGVGSLEPTSGTRSSAWHRRTPGLTRRCSIRRRRWTGSWSRSTRRRSRSTHGLAAIAGSTRWRLRVSSPSRYRDRSRGSVPPNRRVASGISRQRVARREASRQAAADRGDRSRIVGRGSARCRRPLHRDAPARASRRLYDHGIAMVESESLAGGSRSLWSRG